MRNDPLIHQIYSFLSKFLIFVVLSCIILFQFQCATKSLSTQNDVLRAKAKYQGGKIEYADQLINVMNNQNLPFEVRKESLLALGEIKNPKGLDSISLAIPNLAQTNLQLAIIAVQILTQTKNQRYALTVATSLTEARLNYLEFRNSLLGALRQLPDEKIIIPLIEILEYSKEDFYTIQSLIAEMLGSMDDEKVVPILMHISTDETVDLAVRSHVIEMLSKKNDPTIADAFANLLNDPSSQLMVRDFALKAIDDVKDEKLILALLESHQRNKTDYFRLVDALVSALTEFQDPRAIPTLLDIVRNKTISSDLRIKAIGNLAQIADQLAMNDLIDLMHDKENYFLYSFVETLVRSKGSEVDIQRLREASWKAQKETLFNMEN